MKKKNNHICKGQMSTLVFVVFDKKGEVIFAIEFYRGYPQIFVVMPVSLFFCKTWNKSKKLNQIYNCKK